MTRFKECLLHIGTEKTGTTTLQSFLGANRAKLAKHGFFVPASLSPYQAVANHQRLTTFSLRESNLGDDLRRAAGLSSSEDVQSHRAKVRADFIAELSQEKPSAERLLLSNEHCHSRLVFLDEVETLRDFIMEFAEKVIVVVYLRPQHQLAISLYNQALRAGYYDIGILPSFSTTERRWVERRYFDYWDLLSRWSAVFGRANIRPNIFEVNRLVNRSIIDDFLKVLDLSDETLIRPTDRNKSLSAGAQPAMNALNRYARSGRMSITPRLRARAIALLEALSNDEGVLPSRSEVTAFYRQFAEGNELVRKNYYPDQAALFELDFSRYPEKAVEPVSETDSLIETLTAVLSDSSLLKG